jgi:hypothetical protein
MPKSFLNIAGYPLGLRNNNPGNIRPGDSWQGMIGTNSGFVVFENIGYGIRALGIDLRTKIGNGYNTIQLIITRYAPPSENNTQAYINSVVSSTGFSATKILTADGPTLFALIRAIINVEVGPQYAHLITSDDINEGLAMINGLPVGVVATGLGITTILFATALYFVLTRNKPYT